MKSRQQAPCAAASSLRGSRYDAVTRSATPVVSLRKTKTLSVYLATPPWQLNSGETVALKIQVRSRFGIRQISWEGDTQTLSLTAPAKTNNPDGWTVIMPVWRDEAGEKNSWRLAVTVEDGEGQRVTSNWITLRLDEPLRAFPKEDTRWQLIPGSDELTGYRDVD